MPRLPRRWQWTDPACYHLIDRGHNREAVFADDADRAHFSNEMPTPHSTRSGRARASRISSMS